MDCACISNNFIYPSGMAVSNVYDSNNRGYLSEIWHGSEMVWKLNSSNSRGQPVNYTLGNPANNLQASFLYDVQGRVSKITTGQMKQSFSFDPASGNLMWRDYRAVDTIPGLYEAFNYDQLDRLISSVVTSQYSINVSYDEKGNITNKSDAGAYTYDETKVNAVTDITSNTGTISLKDQTIEYNSYNLTTSISEGDSTYSILYNPLNQRIKTVYTPQPGTEITKYYSGGYERTESGGVTKETHYISSPFGLVAIIVKQGESVQTYFTETDHLGSIIGLLNADKTYAERASFDACLPAEVPNARDEGGGKTKKSFRLELPEYTGTRNN